MPRGKKDRKAVKIWIVHQKQRNSYYDSKRHYVATHKTAEDEF